MGADTSELNAVARYLDGRVVKGHIRQINPDQPTFDLTVAGVLAPPLKVDLKELKAIFFVKDLAGNRGVDQRQDAPMPPAGRRLAVRFLDGELLIGTSVAYDPSGEGFFLVPADRFSNNEKVFVVAAAVAEVTLLQGSGD